MLKIILQSTRLVPPFNEPARDLRIQNKPLWLAQRDALAPYTTREMELPPNERLPQTRQACLVYRDNLWFDEFYIRAFLAEATKRKRACRAAFTINDPAFREHCLPLSSSYTPAGGLYLADLWYYPNGPEPEADPLVIDLQAREIGYYHIPTYMASDSGDLVYWVPLRSLIAIDSWVHIFVADMIFGLFGRGARFEKRLNEDLGFKLRILATSLYEGRQVLECSKLVMMGRNVSVDPTAVIHGPTSIGDNVTIGAGAVIENSIIGDNVNVSQGCQLMLSVVGDGTFLPFRASLFMTTIMDNSMVAQNTCLQMCVVGRNSFIGAGSTFTDFNLVSGTIRARDGHGELHDSNRPVLGGCVGHNCRIGAGMIIYPARTIESDVVLFASPERRVIQHDVTYEESDHHKLHFQHNHHQRYPRHREVVEESW
ncbi:N-acetylglucosamine-1-phosphate uridyltransferase [Longilinea arvoryzae]|uniref:N-acetylglucosamine-1-phosphate uridyltransferase n=1 Tax=Longilinea arvoryzae TaxID=360412 RepID=A0A0S7BI33_9CHLR|nr:DapH/DapD/GlmU-related protein [Longilinea arvoryzae]GAP13810.1 N-acetylglucosamine-1-phosphate uridyltransferase [Longilinea arvoryzae]